MAVILVPIGKVMQFGIVALKSATAPQINPIKIAFHVIVVTHFGQMMRFGIIAPKGASAPPAGRLKSHQVVGGYRGVPTVITVYVVRMRSIIPTVYVVLRVVVIPTGYVVLLEK